MNLDEERLELERLSQQSREQREAERLPYAMPPIIESVLPPASEPALEPHPIPLPPLSTLVGTLAGVQPERPAFAQEFEERVVARLLEVGKIDQYFRAAVTGGVQ